MPVTVAATFCATLVDEWIARGVRHVVIAPGSRSTPLALALAARPELDVHVFIDERSAAFCALGIGLATGVPAVVLCTSGTAATHFHAAVVEAHQAEVAMIVCTADRPPELHDVGAPQTIDQDRLFGGAVRWFCDPGVPDVAMTHAWRTLAVRSVLHACGPRPGPVHLNLPFREPLVGDPGPLPASHWSDDQPNTEIQTQVALGGIGTRGVLVAGFGIDEPRQVLRAAEHLGWPVLADPRSGCRVPHPNVVAGFDALLRHDAFAADHRPDTVIRFGQPPASKVLAQWLASSGARQFQVGGPGWSDPDHTATMLGRSAVTTAWLLSSLEVGPSTPWMNRWHRAERIAQRVFAERLTSGPLTEPAVARAVTSSLPDGSTLVVSSSMPIRDVEWFGAPRPGLRVLANRGANGIDGVISTAIGVALTGAPTTLLIGDVAFLHDHGALLQLAGRRIDLTIVVVDNDGGGIFEFLPQKTAVTHDRFELLYGTAHGIDLVALTAAHHLDAVSVTTREELLSHLGSSGIKVVRVPTDRGANVAVHDELNRAVRVAMDDR